MQKQNPSIENTHSGRWAAGLRILIRANREPSLLSSQAARLLVPGDRHLRLLRSLIEESHVRGNRLFDAEIAADCLEHGGTSP